MHCAYGTKRHAMHQAASATLSRQPFPLSITISNIAPLSFSIDCIPNILYFNQTA